MRNIIGKEYIRFLNEIKSRIISARIKAARSVNKELIKLYWDIGRSIIERQERYKWGTAVVEKLANDLKDDLKNTFGFRSKTSGICASSTLNIKTTQFSNSLLENCHGGTIFLFFPKQRTKKKECII